MRHRAFILLLASVGLIVASATSVAGAPERATPRAAVSCEGFRPGDTGPGGPAPQRLVDRCLRINQIQNVGTHNSYKSGVDPEFFPLLEAFDPALAATLEYGHLTLAEQFGAQRARQIELDVFADPDGGRYAERHVNPLLGKELTDGVPPQMSEPGFKAMHVQEVDYLSSCPLFVECLEQIKAWSDANPGHLPITVLVEPKDSPIPDPVDLGFVQPIPFTTALLDDLDAEIRSVFGADDLITPDDVRGAYPTLEAAVLSGKGWPRLRDARGKVMFALDGRRELYNVGNPNLVGKVMFTPSSPGQPDAAFLKMNSPLGGDGKEWRRIRKLVRQGYMIRTRADGDTVQARTGDTTQRDAAMRSSAHWVSTDYPTLERNIFGTDYFVALPRDLVARCNPANTGPRCRSAQLEP